MSHANRFPGMRGRLGLALVLGLIAALCVVLIPAGTAAAAKKGKGTKLTVMTRNLYLGADLTPALQANTVDQAVDAGGEIVNQVHATKFPSVRAALFANEIKKRKPDIVGLQEAAWWRTGPLNPNPGVVTSPTVATTDPLGGDFLTDLLTPLNKGGKKKKGKEATALQDGGRQDGVRRRASRQRRRQRQRARGRRPQRAPDDARRDPGQQGRQDQVNPTSGTFNTLLRVRLARLINVDVTRGWTAVDVPTARSSTSSTPTWRRSTAGSNTTNQGTDLPKGGIREAQATQLVAPGGPATSKYPMVLLGDFNSDAPVQANGDPNALRRFPPAGSANGAPRRRSGAALRTRTCHQPEHDFDHQVDHILANTKKVKFVKGFVDGQVPVNGLCSSDHAAFGAGCRSSSGRSDRCAREAGASAGPFFVREAGTAEVSETRISATLPLRFLGRASGGAT